MKYLTGRKFDAEMLERVWGLQGTGPIGDYRNRIILPIYLDGVPVSYQGRDFTGTSKIPYKACPMEQEVIHHKHILYGVDLVPGDTAVLVEGAADAWRLGPGALATFGTGFTLPQLNLFCRRFKRAFILFDPEEAAQQRADMAGALLAARRIPTEILCLTGEGDPGDLKQDDANHLMRGLL
jgi:DNA primase